MGRSRFDKHRIGWAGHTQEGGVVSNVSGAFSEFALLKYFDLNQFDGKKTVIFLLVEAKS